MKRALPFLILLVVGVLAAAFWLAKWSPRPDSGEPEAVPVEPVTADDSPIDDAASASASARQESSAIDVEPEVEQHAPRIAEATIRGRFVRADGTPAPDVELSITSAITRHMRARTIDLSSTATPVLGKSTASGAFALQFAPVRDAAVELKAQLPSHGVELWNWRSLEPGADVDVGEVRMRLEGVVRGRVLDKNGAGLMGWTVTATDGLVGENLRQVSAAQSGIDGTYRLENLPSGAFDVFAMTPTSNATNKVKVRVAPGQVIDADLRYDGPPLERRVVVRPRFARTTVFLQGDWIEMALIAPGVADRRPKVIAHNPMRFAFDDIEPGEYTLELRDWRVVPVKLEHVQTGSTVDVDIVGSAAIALTVVDDASGESIARFAVESRNESLFGRGTVCSLVDDKSPSSGQALIEGVMAIDQTLIVRADGRAPLEIPIRGLKQGEQRPIEARLAAGAVIEGVVIGSASRKPVPSARVRLLRKQPPVPKGQPRLPESPAGPNASATTDANGRFTISGVALGEIEASVTVGSKQEKSEALTISASVLEKRTPLTIEGPGVVHVELEAPAAGRLVGRVIAPSGASFDDLALFVAHIARTPEGEPVIKTGGVGANIDANGAFSTPWIEAGEAIVRLVQRRPRTTVGDAHWKQNRCSPIDIGTVMLAPDVETRRDFDVRETFPCAVEVRVTAPEGLGIGLDVELRDARAKDLSWLATTDERGRALLPAVPPSTYVVHIRDPDSKWLWTDPRGLRVDPAVTTRHEAVVELVDVELTLRAGDPLVPLADTWVKLDPVGVGTPWGAVVTTDAFGRVPVKLQLGRWMVRPQRQGVPKQSNQAAEFDVTASGPRAFTLDLGEQPR